MLTSADLAELERCARQMDGDNHHRFLSEALACLRQHRDPIAVYELLAKLQVAARDKEDAALTVVRTWLDTQLADPTLRTVEALELRLVWTRRIARIVKSQKLEHDNRPAPAPVRPPPRDLLVLRKKYPLLAPSPPRPVPPLFRPTPTSEPGSREETPALPDALEVLFANHGEAIKALKQASKTLPGQAVHPRSARELTLAASGVPFPLGIENVTLRITAATVGLAAYLKELNGPRNGAAFPFRVAQLERQGTRLVAGEILHGVSGKA